MPGATRSYTLDVSEYLFRLTTESLRLRSNTTMRFETVASLVNDRTKDGVNFDHLDSDTLREHLKVIPTKGSNRFHMTVDKVCADCLIEAKKRLAGRLGMTLTVADVFSVLLFDFVAEHHARRVLSKVLPDQADDLQNNWGSAPSVVAQTNAIHVPDQD